MKYILSLSVFFVFILQAFSIVIENNETKLIVDESYVESSEYKIYYLEYYGFLDSNITKLIDFGKVKSNRNPIRGFGIYNNTTRTVNMLNYTNSDDSIFNIEYLENCYELKQNSICLVKITSETYNQKKKI